jgi:transcriptional regulator with XRE-family HTH domain
MRLEATPSIPRFARASAEHETPQKLDLGARVRALRKNHGWSQEQVAKAAGLARSTLSTIQNGQMSPSCEALKKLASGRSVSVPRLFTPPEKSEVTGRLAVTRAGEGAAHPPAPHQHELPAGVLSRKKMLPYRARIRARSRDEFDGWVRQDGEELHTVLIGTIRLFTSSTSRSTCAAATARLTLLRWVIT